MMIKNMRVRPCLLLIENGAMLLMHYRYGEADVFGIPGGAPDKGETLKDALVRELKEELSVQVNVKQLIMVGEIIHKEKGESILNCLFSGEIVSGKPSVNPLYSTALGVSWKPIYELEKFNLYPNIGKEIAAVAENNFKVCKPYIGLINQRWF